MERVSQRYVKENAMTEQRRCERCGGSGEILPLPLNPEDLATAISIDTAPTEVLKVPCPDCGGTGILSADVPLTSWD